ncbi:MAG: Rieske 2Fe-2S domain-containing protein [Candidatus Solibacter usitatus]|nr:Rieske 2Fe-2S domain-containing protein [Candidatus Solibacter usitatus]
MEPNLARASTIPSQWYTDPSFLNAEKEGVFWRTWQPLCHRAQVANVGDYCAGEIAGEPVAVVRGHDGILRAFSNVCRHRASVILSEHGNAKSLRCPYHAWTYALDGNLLNAPEFEGVECWKKEDVRLPAYGLTEWGPYVFVNLDAQAIPFAEMIQGIPEHAQRLHFAHRRDYTIACNWKVYVDNYLEGYHLPAAHPSLFRELDYNAYRVDTARYYSSQYAPIRPPRSGRDEPRRYDDAAAGQQALYYWVFPNLMLNIYPDNLSVNIILPLGHDRTLTIFEWFSYAGKELDPAAIAFSDEIQQEDIRICESVQKGLQSRSYDRGRYSVKRENGVHHFHLLLEEFLAVGQISRSARRSPDRLCR